MHWHATLPSAESVYIDKKETNKTKAEEKGRRLIEHRQKKISRDWETSEAHNQHESIKLFQSELYKLKG